MEAFSDRHDTFHFPAFCRSDFGPVPDTRATFADDVACCRAADLLCAANQSCDWCVCSPALCLYRCISCCVFVRVAVPRSIARVAVRQWIFAEKVTDSGRISRRLMDTVISCGLIRIPHLEGRELCRLKTFDLRIPWQDLNSRSATTAERRPIRCHYDAWSVDAGNFIHTWIPIRLDEVRNWDSRTSAVPRVGQFVLIIYMSRVNGVSLIKYPSSLAFFIKRSVNVKLIIIKRTIFVVMLDFNSAYWST